MAGRLPPSLESWRIQAELIYRAHINAEEPTTAEELAADFTLPVAAVVEAIEYGKSNPQKSRPILPEKRRSWQLADNWILNTSTIRTRESSHLRSGHSCLPDVAVHRRRFCRPRFDPRVNR